MKGKLSLGSALLILIGLWVPVVFGAVPGTMSFQGRLTTSVGLPITGAASLVFTICADSACTQQLWTENQNGVLINDGLFDVRLGAANPLPATVFDGSLRWLAVTVEGEAGTRRFPLQSVPYAYRSVNSDTAAYAKSGASTDCSGCDSRFVNVSGPDSVFNNNGTAFRGIARSNVLTPSTGVYGYASNSSSANAYAGYFTVGSEGSGDHTGVYTYASGSSSESVFGVNATGDNSSTGKAIGGQFAGVGDGNGKHYGVITAGYGSADESSFGTWSEATNISSGDVYGGYFRANSNGTGNHYAISGNAYGASSSPTYGLNSVASNTSTGNVFAGNFDAQSGGSGNHYGVQATATGSADASTFGVRGEGTNTSTGDTYGGYFKANSDGTGKHYAISGNAYGASTVPTYGVYGLGQNTSTGVAYGGYFKASTSGTGTHYAIFGDCTLASGNNYAGWFSGHVVVTGDFVVLGAKSAVVEVSKGEHRAVYCQESPENWFEDFGEGQLVNGVTHINLDPLFLQTVTIDAANPMKVFVQLEGDCKGVYVTKGTTGFDVKELQAGTGNVPFSYRVVAKRRGFEDIRMATVTLPTAEEQAAMRNYPQLDEPAAAPAESAPEQ